ncbi:predicted protein [Verticillium alfalfae VaMs.102]|uniref:Predicted protein n=1 Tax=Verticillium alfalfae (strain VaMs.102 / ATCC MYA-4576 / FGSC 10136) TaxID=526221 RepID=C9S787_VERA1|nr:predicted protein [Verticillium alfalfae VaMs.102]EEY14672.1 predicted protein [Verticillium alfalfae VaMs.102]
MEADRRCHVGIQNRGHPIAKWYKGRGGGAKGIQGRGQGGARSRSIEGMGRGSEERVDNDEGVDDARRGVEGEEGKEGRDPGNPDPLASDGRTANARKNHMTAGQRKTTIIVMKSGGSGDQGIKDVDDHAEDACVVLFERRVGGLQGHLRRKTSVMPTGKMMIRDEKGASIQARINCDGGEGEGKDDSAGLPRDERGATGGISDFIASASASDKEGHLLAASLVSD